MLHTLSESTSRMNSSKYTSAATSDALINVEGLSKALTTFAAKRSK